MLHHPPFKESSTVCHFVVLLRLFISLSLEKKHEKHLGKNPSISCKPFVRRGLLAAVWWLGVRRKYQQPKNGGWRQIYPVVAIMVDGSAGAGAVESAGEIKVKQRWIADSGENLSILCILSFKAMHTQHGILIWVDWDQSMGNQCFLDMVSQVIDMLLPGGFHAQDQTFNSSVGQVFDLGVIVHWYCV